MALKLASSFKAGHYIYMHHGLEVCMHALYRPDNERIPVITTISEIMKTEK